MVLNSKIYLAKNIKLDSNYKNVLSYNEDSMLNLVMSNSIASSDTYQFIRERNSIHVDFKYSDCVEANYIAYQNPDYSNKWFFAFIDEVNYKSNSSTEIKFTIDVWSTWYGKWNPKECFIEREHIIDDSIGNNIVAENLELGEYVTNKTTKINLGDIIWVIHVTESIVKEPQEKFSFVNVGGIYMTGGYYIARNPQEMNLILASFYDRPEAIINVFTIPSFTVIGDSMLYAGQNNPSVKTASITINNSIDKYIPKNNKLYTYPYNLITMTNNSGTSNNLLYERFNNIDDLNFEIKGIAVAGGSIKMYPLNYKGISKNQEELILAGKYPISSYSTDYYNTWLRQNSLNIGLGIISSGLTVAGGIGLMATGAGAVAGGSMIVGGIQSIAGTLAQKYTASITPNTAKGNINGGDINTADEVNTFYLYQKSITYNNAKIIDEYFSRFGYQTNLTKIPNLTTRGTFNFIKLGEGEDMCLGDIPTNYSKIINKIGQTGVTIWHNHANIGNFD